MSYIALARKYRPQNFQHFIGQQHVVRALSNAIDKQRLHHAYLLTGTRGVGKTSLGRILAKCLNCEVGITSQACDQCDSCQEISAGQSLDLIEIDAASNTGVDDTRAILENVQYAPNRDRFKIYLIDEVHMLSNHSFNALLKTLEEPPEHVKFILATTDPQKLPITVLSRCLQFNLKNMPADMIAKHLTDVCQQEAIEANAAALLQLAQAAQGSMRDALSLLDQAIAYSDDQIDVAQTQAMLGHIADDQIDVLLSALAQQDGQTIYAHINHLASIGIDFNQALNRLLDLLHRISVAQLLPDLAQHESSIRTLAQQFSQQDIQLYYQIALVGRRDIDLAPSTRMGFEMLLLRMLCFVPVDSAIVPANNKPITPKNVVVEASTKPDIIEKQTIAHHQASPVKGWPSIVASLALKGSTAALVKHCALAELNENSIHLQIDPKHGAMLNEMQTKRLQDALNHYFQKPMLLKIDICTPNTESPIAQKQRQQAAGKQAIKQALENDPNVQALLDQFDATLDEQSINLNNEDKS